MSSFWNALTGKKPNRQQSEHASPSTDAPPDSGDIAPTTSFTQAPSSSSSSSSSSSYPLSSSAPFDPSTAADVSSFLNPANVADLHPLAGLDKGLTYLELDDAALSSLPGSRTALPSRGWSDDLCYGTGTTYLVALTLGGAWGMAEGIRKVAPEAPPRLKLNGILNAVTRRGPFLGNSAGVLAMVYNGINSTVGYYRGKHDVANSIVSGALAGAIFKSTRGVRPMIWSSSMVAAAAGVWSVGSKVLL